MDTNHTAKLSVNAGVSIGNMRKLQGTTGIPAPAAGADQCSRYFERVEGCARNARSGLTIGFRGWTRLITKPAYFPTGQPIPMIQRITTSRGPIHGSGKCARSGADVLFTIASEIPSNKQPVRDLDKYEQVLENIVRHYVCGWGNGFQGAITHWEFGDQPDFGTLHFSRHTRSVLRDVRDCGAGCEACRPRPEVRRSLYRISAQ